MPVEEPEVNAPPEEAGVLEDLPVLTVRDTVIYPGALLPITVGRPSSLALVQSLGENRTLAVVSQLDPRVEAPGPEDLYQVGTVCVMHKAIKVPKDNLLLFCEGIARIRTLEFTATEPFLRARVERLPEIEPEITPELEALRQNVLSAVPADRCRVAQSLRRTVGRTRRTSPNPGGWRISSPGPCPA